MHAPKKSAKSPRGGDDRTDPRSPDPGDCAHFFRPVRHCGDLPVDGSARRHGRRARSGQGPGADELGAGIRTDFDKVVASVEYIAGVNCIQISDASSSGTKVVLEDLNPPNPLEAPSVTYGDPADRLPAAADTRRGAGRGPRDGLRRFDESHEVLRCIGLLGVPLQGRSSGPVRW